MYLFDQKETKMDSFDLSLLYVDHVQNFTGMWNCNSIRRTDQTGDFDQADKPSVPFNLGGSLCSWSPSNCTPLLFHKFTAPLPTSLTFFTGRGGSNSRGGSMRRTVPLTFSDPFFSIRLWPAMLDVSKSKPFPENNLLSLKNL